MKSLEDLEAALERGLSSWEQEIMEKHANRMGHKIVREVKRLTPVNTGNLRRRWFARIDRQSRQIIIWVANDAEYAASVNNGHRVVRAKKTVGFSKGKYMLEKGIQTYQITYMKQDIEEMLKELGKALK